jgi:5'(3')-deoxyribonucleotidase
MNTKTQNRKKILYVDMDNMLVDFPHGIECLSDEEREAYKDKYDECPDIFSKMIPMPDAIESYKELARHFDTYILSTSPWLNPSAWRHKLEWVQAHLGSTNNEPAYKRLILTHHKNLNKGDFLVDDRPNNGASEFEGEWIKFGSPEFPDWITVKNYLMKFV